MSSAMNHRKRSHRSQAIRYQSAAMRISKNKTTTKKSFFRKWIEKLFRRGEEK